jgi:hypothetical protein
MSIDKYNSEGYYDPTAYEALTLIFFELIAMSANIVRLKVWR